MLKAVIFDMDGLMIDSENLTFEGYLNVFSNRQEDIHVDFYKSLLGNPLPVIYELFYKEYGYDFPIIEIIEEVHQYMHNYFETKGIPLKKGLIPLLKYLKTKNIKTIVATSSERTRVDYILEKANLSTYFDDSICGDEVENGKPNPDIFLNACKKISIHPTDAIVLEDSIQGIEAAHRAGIPVYCIPDMLYPPTNYASKTAGIVDNLEDMIPIINVL